MAGYLTSRANVSRGDTADNIISITRREPSVRPPCSPLDRFVPPRVFPPLVARYRPRTRYTAVSMREIGSREISNVDGFGKTKRIERVFSSRRYSRNFRARGPRDRRRSIVANYAARIARFSIKSLEKVCARQRNASCSFLLPFLHSLSEC